MAQQRKAQSKKTTARKPARKKPAAKRKPAAKKKPAARKKAAPRKTAQAKVDSLNLLVLTRERIQEAVDEAVSRGSMTRDAAQDLVSGLVDRGRRQTSDVLSDLEQLLGRGGGSSSVAARARKQVEEATARARDAGDTVLAQADRARRAAGVGPSFPIVGYDDMTASQIQGRLGTLTPAELRKVRDYEKRNANRKSVLSAIESKLG